MTRLENTAGGRTWMRSLATVTLLATSLPALAHDPESGEEAEEPRWEGTAGLAFVTTSGNTDTQNVGFDFQLERLPEPWGLELKAQVGRAEEDGSLTAERYLAGLRAKRAVGERWELFVGASGEQDEFAGLDLRTVAEAGFAVNALVGPEHFLTFDIGVTWTDEDRLPPVPDTDYIGGLVGFAYEWKISDTASFTERLTYYPNFDDSDDWRFDSTTALTASLSARFALQLSYEVRFRNQPIDGRDDTDTATKASLVLNL